jgi:hypothetical protein
MKGLLIQTEGWGKISYDEEILEYGTCKSYSDKMSLSFGLHYTL